MSALLPKETLYPWPPKETPYLCLPTSTIQPYKNHIFYLLSFQDCSVSGIGSLIPEQLNNNHASIVSPSSLPPITQSEDPIVKMVVKRGIKVHVFHYSLKFKNFGEIHNYQAQSWNNRSNRDQNNSGSQTLSSDSSKHAKSGRKLESFNTTPLLFSFSKQSQ